jgi:hypothetical protein
MSVRAIQLLCSAEPEDHPFNPGDPPLVRALLQKRVDRGPGPERDDD